jgi:hypothetical protein
MGKIIAIANQKGVERLQHQLICCFIRVLEKKYYLLMLIHRQMLLQDWVLMLNLLK